MKLYQIALKYSSSYSVLNSSILYSDKTVATLALENLKVNTIYGDGEYVLLEYSPFKVYEMNGKGKLAEMVEGSPSHRKK